MLTIRLARTGRAKYPTYRIVAADSKRAASGKFVSILGHYNPHSKELVLKKEDIQSYLKNGAQPSNTVVKLLQRENVELPKWVSLKTKADKKAAEAAAAAEVAKAEAEAAKSDDASAEEAPSAAEDSEAAVVVQAEENSIAHGENVSSEGDTEMTDPLNPAETPGETAHDEDSKEQAGL